MIFAVTGFSLTLLFKTIMNLIFDIGNSSTKLAVFDEGNKVSVFRSKNFSGEQLGRKLSAFNIDKAIISSVKEIPNIILELLGVNIPLIHILTHQSKLPFNNGYESPETIGPDRIAAVAGAYKIYPDSEVLIIDAGTAITYEFLSGNKYRGGNISPGLNMRFRALNKFTGKLPLIKPDSEASYPGRNTAEAIRSGVITGMVYEINEYIRTFEKLHPDAKVILTGGDGLFFKDKIGNQIIYMPDIVMDGLNFILEYNAK
jgi:type III pantothenate kinase